MNISEESSYKYIEFLIKLERLLSEYRVSIELVEDRVIFKIEDTIYNLFSNKLNPSSIKEFIYKED